MTDKQIIIDGVDVSGCEFAVKPINDNEILCHCAKGLLQIAKMQEQPESIRSGLCENNPNCYYKQLKRKEQECKNNKIAYQMEVDIYNQECLNLQNELKETFEQLDQLKKENEDLKKTVDDLLHKPEIQDKILWKIDNKELLLSKDTWIYKLEQTIAEIKEISENVIKNVSDRCIETTPMYYIHKQILQKISEVIDDKNS